MADMVSQPLMRLKKLGDAGEIEGYASTFGGEPDSYGDVIAPGAYADSLAWHKARGSAPKMFWQHDSAQPIGKWTDLAEDETGLFVRGSLNMEVQRGREAHALLKAGDIDGLSIGYRIREYSVDTETGIWTLQKIDLLEVSVVSIPANDNAAVSSVKAARAARQLIERLKAGERLTEREFEAVLRGSLGLSNSQAERAVRLHLKGQGEPAGAAKDASAVLAELRALLG